MKRIAWVLIAVIAGAGLAGCQASKGGGAGAKVGTEVAPNLDQYNIERVAILSFANTTGDDEADLIVDYVTRALYETGKYQFATISEFRSDARRADLEAEYDRLVESWLSTRKFELARLTRLMEATGYDALLGIECNKWEEVKLEATQEGTSDTSVGLRLEMTAADGTLLWAAKNLKRAESPPYYPEGNIRATESGLARTTSQGAIPDPPPIENVALEVVNETVAELPDIKGGAPAGQE